MDSDPSRKFQLNLFGHWQLKHGGKVVPMVSRQQRVIAAVAILGRHRRCDLGGILWPEKSEPRALESLRVSLHLISRQAPGLLVPDGATLDFGPGVTVDLHRMIDMVKNGNPRHSEGQGQSLMSLLRRAELLPGWYEDWIVFEQSRLSTVRFAAYQDLARSHLVRRNFDRATEAARAAVQIEPLHEGAVQLLIRIELQAGNHAAALHAFEAFRDHLLLELGIGPSADLLNLITPLYQNTADFIAVGNTYT